MSMKSRWPRPGRLLDWLVVALLLFIFVGLAVYHYGRIGEGRVDPERARELAERKLSDRKADPAVDWPQWRGPNRDGVSTETGLLASWPTDGPKVLWEAKTGDGFASVAIAKGRAFTIFQDGDHEAVVAWDAETGREIWRYRYECAYKNNYGNGPRSTPTIDGDTIYTVGGSGLMHCLDAFTDQPNGKVVWKKDLMEGFAAKVPKWGVAFSPLVEGDRVFIMPGGPNGQSLAALDKKTGAVIWQKHSDSPSYSSPIGTTFHGQRQVLFLTGTRLVSVAPDDGTELWSFPWKTQENCNIATPIVVDDYVFISASYGKGCAVLKVEKAGDKWTPSLVYKNRNMRNHFSTSVRWKDYLFGFDDSDLKCIDFRTGESTWDMHGFDKGSVLLVGDQLIVYGANGILALADANPREYVERSRFQFSKVARSCWSVPVVANGRLYVRDTERLVCFDVKGK